MITPLLGHQYDMGYSVDKCTLLQLAVQLCIKSFRKLSTLCAGNSSKCSRIYRVYRLWYTLWHYVVNITFTEHKLEKLSIVKATSSVDTEIIITIAAILIIKLYVSFSKEILSKLVSLSQLERKKGKQKLYHRKVSKVSLAMEKTKSFHPLTLPTECLCSSFSVLCAIKDAGDNRTAGDKPHQTILAGSCGVFLWAHDHFTAPCNQTQSQHCLLWSGLSPKASG